ncbi:MAG: hypothetical protein HY518_03440 [Candidatus Aenigmarchaeota archaeon]|nr:hypothetical protein [Candidatus Aenigmarchaeota archaeon]
MEFVAIIGIAIVAVVVILFAFSGAGPALSPDQRTVSDSVGNMIRQATLETISTVGEQGGYLTQDYPQGAVVFSGGRTPYWEYNGNVVVPDIEENIEKGIEQYVDRNKESLRESFGFDISFGPPRVSMSTMADKMEVTVSMPTTIKGESFSQPYKVAVPTRFGEIIDFSPKFARYANDNRPIETFTLASMALSPVDATSRGPAQTVPFVVQLNRCGESVYKDYGSIRGEVDGIIRRTLARTYLPGKYPVHEAGGYDTYELQDTGTLVDDKVTPFIDPSVTSPQYTLEPIDGNPYSEIDLSFWLPDGFSLSRNSFAFTPDPVIAYPKPIPMTDICQSEPVYVKYSLNYPVIVKVKDPLTGASLNFANTVFIKDNQPAPWADVGVYAAQADLCDSIPLCIADVHVADGSGRPVEAASVSFIGCPAGETDATGAFRGRVICGLGLLQVEKEGYDTFGDLYSSSKLPGARVTLQKRPGFTLSLYEVNVRDESLAGQYRINEIDVYALPESRYVYMLFVPLAGSEVVERIFESPQATMESLPAGEYIVSATIVDRETNEGIGGIVTGFTVTEDLDGQNVNAYLPYLFEYRQQTDEEKIHSGYTMEDLFRNADCNLGPLSTARLAFDGCVVKQSDLV